MSEIVAEHTALADEEHQQLRLLVSRRSTAVIAVSARGTKINSPDPVLTAVCTA
jgi:hypothetical protein